MSERVSQVEVLLLVVNVIGAFAFVLNVTAGHTSPVLVLIGLVNVIASTVYALRIASALR